MKIDPAPNFPQKYSTRVEVNQLEDDTTYEMQAYYDYSKKRASLDFKENNIWKKLIFNYETDEIYLLICKILIKFFILSKYIFSSADF